MFDWIVSASLRLRFLVLSVAAALVVLGAMQMRKMPVDVFPEFAPPVVEVQTEAVGLSAEEVESMITYSLEELLSGVPWIESTRSRSVTGLSSVMLIFKRGTDVMKARQMVQERLALAYTLPNVATPPVILQPMSATSRFMMVALSSDTIEPTELSLLARWTIKPKLVGVPGVSNVSVWGQRLRQLHVHFDPNRLKDVKVMQEDIIAATGDALWVSPLTFLKASSPGSGGWIDNSNQRLGVEHNMPIESPEDLAKIAVTSPHLLMAGRSMALGDVTETTFSHAPVIGDAIVGKGGHGLMLVIEKFPGANTLEVTRNVEQALTELRRGLPGVKVDSNVFKLADYVNDSMSNFSRAIVIGAALLVLVIAAFFTQWRSVVVAVVSLPVALMAAVLALRYLETGINTMVLAGLVVALGVVIDSAVVDAQRLRDSLRSRADRSVRGALNTVYQTTVHTQRTAVYASLIAALAAVPIYFMGGVSGSFFEPLATAYLLAIFAAMVVALTVTPVVAMLLMGPASSGDSSTNAAAAASSAPACPAWVDKLGLAQRHEQWLGRLVGKPMLALGVTAGLVLLAAAVWPFMGQSLLPQLKEQQLLVNWTTPPGTSHAETYRVTARVAKELETIPGVKNVGAHVGRAVTGDQVVGINASQIWVSLDPSADRDATLAAIRNTVDGYPGIDHSTQSYLRDKVGEVLTGQSKPVVVRIFGPQRAVLKEKAEEVRAAIAGIPGVVDLVAEGQVEEPHVQVKVNLEAAGKANVKPGDVRRSAASIFSGLVVGYLFKDQRIFEVVVWGAPETRANLSNLADLWVEKSDRSHTRLGDIADVSVTSTPTVMKHEGRAPYVDVVMGVEGRNPSAVVAEVAKRLATVKFPLEYHPELLGEYARRGDNFQRMAGVIVAVLAGVFLLLQACLRNWSLAGVGFAALLASTAAAVLVGAATSGGVFTLGSMVGFLAVLGIAARQHVMMLAGLQALESNGRDIHGTERSPMERFALVVQGTRERLPSLLTSVAATAVAVLPIAAMGHLAGLEVMRPTAIIIVGGLVISMLLTLLVVPALYLMVGSTQRRDIELEDVAGVSGAEGADASGTLSHA
jgi:Cu/Ag efflux pump CusA